MASFTQLMQNTRRQYAIARARTCMLPTRRWTQTSGKAIRLLDTWVVGPLLASINPYGHVHIRLCHKLVGQSRRGKISNTAHITEGPSRKYQEPCRRAASPRHTGRGQCRRGPGGKIGVRRPQVLREPWTEILICCLPNILQYYSYVILVGVVGMAHNMGVCWVAALSWAL